MMKELRWIMIQKLWISQICDFDFVPCHFKLSLKSLVELLYGSPNEKKNMIKMWKQWDVFGMKAIKGLYNGSQN
jgi:hypothetical protein